MQDDGQRLQVEILQQLKKVTERLDQVEQKIAVSMRSSTPSAELSTDSFLENIKSSKHKKRRPVSRGEVDVQVKHKVHWPHEAILGGTARQHVTYCNILTYISSRHTRTNQ